MVTSIRTMMTRETMATIMGGAISTTCIVAGMIK
jgi:hypothetical protein